LGWPTRGGQAGPVDVADHHRQVAEALAVEPERHLLDRGDAGVHEGGAQHEVLDGVAGEEHLGEHGQVRAAVGGPAGPRHELVGVAGQVAYGRVRLGQGDTQLCHGPSLVRGYF
jgi:hypothetical protein